MNTDLHALIMDMANQLDFDRQCLMDNRSLTHPLADRARAALAAEPEGAPMASPAAGLAVRPLLEMVMGIGISTTLGQIHTIQDRIRGWLDANPPGQPIAIEPRGCPLPGACSCVEVPPPAPVPVADVRYEFAVYDALTDEPHAGGEAPTLEEAQREGQNYFAVYSEDGPMRLELRRVEMLPQPEVQP